MQLRCFPHPISIRNSLSLSLPLAVGRFHSVSVSVRVCLLALLCSFHKFICNSVFIWFWLDRRENCHAYLPCLLWNKLLIIKKMEPKKLKKSEQNLDHMSSCPHLILSITVIFTLLLYAHQCVYILSHTHTRIHTYVSP